MTTDARGHDTRPHPDRAWQVVRWTALACWLLGLAATVATGMRIEPYRALEDDLRSGAVTEVRIEGAMGGPEGLDPATQGVATVRLVWQDGWHRAVSEVRQGTTQEELDTQGAEGPAVVGRVDTALRDLSPDVRLVWVDERDASTRANVTTTLAGWEAGGWPGVLTVVGWVLALVAVGGGPEPAYATRWAWAWLFLSPWSVVAVPLHLVLGARGHRPGRRRLTGGWSFLLMLVTPTTVWVATS